MIHTYAARVWRSNTQRRIYLGSTGKVVSYSVIHVPPTGMEGKSPYVVGVIQIGKECIVSRVVDCDEKELSVGMEVTGVIRRLFCVSPEDVIQYGVVFSARSV